jgi:hypothetical protein
MLNDGTIVSLTGPTTYSLKTSSGKLIEKVSKITYEVGLIHKHHLMIGSNQISKEISNGRYWAAEIWNFSQRRFIR